MRNQIYNSYSINQDMHAKVTKKSQVTDYEK